MTTTQILEAAKALIADPERWTRGAEFWEKRGKAWCAGSAIETIDRDYHDALDCLGFQSMDGVIEWNDTHTHAEVMEAFNRAIEASRESGKSR